MLKLCPLKANGRFPPCLTPPSVRYTCSLQDIFGDAKWANRSHKSDDR